MSDARDYWNPERETMSMDEIRELQDEKVPHAVGRGYSAPFLRDLWNEAGMSPADVETIEDLREAPLFRKDDSRDLMIETGEPFGGRLSRPFADLAEEGAKIGTSSGTTGTSTNVLLSEKDLDVAAETEARKLWAAGLRPGDVQLILSIPHHLGTNVTPMDAAKKIGAASSMVSHMPDEIPRMIHVLEYLEPTVVQPVTKPIINAMDDYFAENDVDPAEVWEPVESVFSGGEPILEDTRSHLEDDWGVEVFEHSGGLEPHWYPFECSEHGRWLHVPDDHFYVETIDIETEEPLDDERGELVVTALTYDGMGYLRWAHDDIVDIKRGECDCGRVGTKLKFLGRVGDAVKVGDRHILPADVLPIVTAIEEMPKKIFQFYPDSEETLGLRLGYDADAVSDTAAFARRAEEVIGDELDVPVEIREVTSESDLMSKYKGAAKIPRVVK